MYKVSNPSDILVQGGVLVFVPFSTQRKDGVPSIPDELVWEIPNAKKTFERIKETSLSPRDTYYYMGNGNNYIFHRVKSSSKAASVSLDMLNRGVDILEEEFPINDIVLVFGTGDSTADEYLKLLFKGNNSVYFLERQP